MPLTGFPVFNIKPIAGGSQLTHELAPYFLDWLAHPTYDSYWKQWSIEENYQNIQVPALTIAAWYDLFQGGSLRNYLGLKAHAGNQAARDGQHLLIAIGGHSGWSPKVGDVDFGPDAAFDEAAITLDWFEYLLLGKQNQFASGNPVRIFVMGKNQWRDEPAWPLARANETQYYLHSEGKANSASGDGSLSPATPTKESADTFVYDPANPVPTVGGPLCCDSVISPLDHAIRKTWKPAPTCSFIPPCRSIRISKSRARSLLISSRGPLLSTPTSPASSSTFGPTALRRI